MEILPSTEIVKIYRQCSSKPENNIPDKRTLIRWLSEKLQNRIDVWSPKYGESFIFNNEVEKGKIIEVLCKKIESVKSMLNPISIEEQVKNVGIAIRKEVNEMESTYKKWPADEDSLYERKTVIPPLLKLLSEHLLSSSKRICGPKQTRIDAICQDIIYVATNGNHRCSKHVTLALSTKRKTGSKEMVTWLNKYGSGISYDEVNFLETSLAEDLTLNVDIKSFVPKSIKPGSFVTFVYDNNDINPESILGRSMHVTNGIIVQRITDLEDGIDIETGKIFECPKPKMQSRKRSFKALENHLPRYTSQKRSGDVSNHFQELKDDCVDLQKWKVSEFMDFIWIVLRNTSYETIPNWSGFNYLLELPTSEFLHNVAYLPAINSSPTEMDTVLEVLQQSKAKAENLGLKEADVVLDQAIYAKAVEILQNPNHLDLKKFIVLRMGAFHTICIFFAVIGKRFGDAGLRDWIIEADIIGKLFCMKL